jgi:hypothetical protein
VIQSIDEGIQSLMAEKRELSTDETHIIRPSTTIILGQNSSDDSKRIGEIFDLFIKRDVYTFNGHDHSKMFQFLRV